MGKKGKRTMTGKRLTVMGLVGAAALCAVLGRPHVARTTSGVQAAGIPGTMLANAAMSAAIATTVGGLGQPYQEVDLLGDWDGSEDNVADHAGKIDDLSTTFTIPTSCSHGSPYPNIRSRTASMKISLTTAIPWAT
jgi:hypothetical protein